MSFSFPSNTSGHTQMNTRAQDPETPLSNVLEQMAHACDTCERVQVRDIMKAIGERSFGPLLLVPSLLVVSPLSGIVGLPTVVGFIVVLVAGQLLIGMDHVWLPRFLLDRSVPAKRLHQAVGFLRPVAGAADKFVGRRLLFLTTGPAVYVIAAMCILIALVMPVFELVPFANSVWAAAIAAFGLALTARDGVLAAIAFLLTGAAIYFAAAALLFS